MELADHTVGKVDPTMEEEEVVTDNTENRFAVDLLFVKLLLPALRGYVSERIETFFEEHPVLKKPGGYRELATDPVKKSVDLVHPIMMYPNDDTLPSFNEFSKLYFEKPFFENLKNCGDVRVFLVLVTKAGCFSNAQATVAYRLKNQRDTLAHQEIISDRMKGEVFENVELLLRTIPDTNKSLEGMDKAKEHGVRSFLRFPRRNSKSQKKTATPAQMISEHFCNSNENRSVFVNTHLLVTFYVNLFCLALSLASMATCNVSSQPQIKDLGLESAEVSEKEDLKVDSKEKSAEKDETIDIEAAIDNIETKKNNQDFVNENNNQNCFKNKSENNKEKNIRYNNEHDQENYDTKNSNKVNKDQDKKCEKEITELRRRATNDKASNTWITTMKKETKKARLVIKSETERKRNDSWNSSSGKPTAMEVGYHFNCWDPSPDPRFHPDTQLMIGPIPVSLDHEGLYYNLRTNFEARGRVRFMFIHKNFTKDRKTLQTVKFGYVVFEEKCDAQRLVKEGVVSLIKEKATIKLREMAREVLKAHM